MPRFYDYNSVAGNESIHSSASNGDPVRSTTQVLLSHKAVVCGGMDPRQFDGAQLERNSCQAAKGQDIRLVGVVNTLS